MQNRLCERVSLRDAMQNRLSEQVSVVVIDLVQTQQFAKFVFKRLVCMMASLVLYVLDHLICVGSADRENAKAVLPREVLHVWEFPAYPKRRVALHELSDSTWGKCRRRARQRMNMIVNAANLQGRYAMFASNTADVSPDSRFDIGPYQILSVLGAKDKMVVTMGICIGHLFTRRYATSLF
jgi:hypothetical protein